MYLTQTELGEGLLQHLVAVLKVLQVTLLRFLNQREDDIHLAPFVDLLTDAVVERGHARVEDMGSSHGLTAWRQLVDHTHVEVAVEGHGEGTRNRGGGHHEHMGRILTLRP